MRPKTLWLAIGMGMACLSASLSAGGQAVGKFTLLTGRVEIRRGQEPPRKALPLSQFRAGDRIILKEKASATVVFYADEARYALPAKSSFQVEAGRLKHLSGPDAKPLNTPQAQRSSKPSHPGDYRFTGMVLRGGPPDKALDPRHPFPVGSVRDVAVTLRWKSPISPGTENSPTGRNVTLKLMVVDLDEKQKILSPEPMPVTTQEFALPTGLIQAGHWYEWTVMAQGKGFGTESWGAKFRVLTEEERAEVEEQEREAEEARRNAPNDSAPDLALAAVYEEYGLLEDAIKAHEAALKRLRKMAGKE